MTVLQEAIFARLYPRYERTFGEPPPFRTASVDEAIAYMRSRLRAYSNEAANTLCAPRYGEGPAQHARLTESHAP